MPQLVCCLFLPCHGHTPLRPANTVAPRNLNAGPKPVCAKYSYGRGVGTIPNQCPSDKPAYDAGLCYPNCMNASPIYRGVGESRLVPLNSRP